MVSSDSQSEPRLAELCSRFFLFVTTFRRNARGPEIRLDYVRDQLTRLIDEIEAEIQTQPDLRVFSDDTKYALVALADEIALQTDWSGADDWEDELLEQKYYGTSLAGEDFYAKLEALKPGEDQLAEIYFLCLSLGFKGKYRSQPERRLELQKRLYHSLPNRLASKNEPLCPGIEDATYATPMQPIPLIGVLRSLILIFLLLGTGMIAAHVIASFQTKNLKTNAEKLSQAIKND